MTAVDGPGRAASGAPRQAVLLGGTAWLLACAGLVLFAVAGPSALGDELFLVVDAMVGLVYGATAGVVLWRRRHPVAYLLALTSIGGGLAALAGGWRTYAHTRGLEAGPFGDWFGLAWVPGTLALFLVVPWLVRERPLGRAWWGPAGGAVLTAAALASSVFLDIRVLMAAFAAAVLYGLVTAAGVELRRRRSPEAEAVGLGWLAVGTAVMALSFVPVVVPLAPSWVTPVLHLACQALFPAAVLSVVLRQRLWGIELAVSRALLAAALTLGLAVVYAAVTAALGRLVPAAWIAQAAAAAAVVLLAQPLRQRFERQVHRMVYGVAHDPWRTASRMGTALGRASDPDLLLSSLVETVGTALRLESVTLRSEQEQVLAAWGTPTGAALSVPLAAGTGPVGTLVATARPGEALDTRTRRALEELSAVVASGLVLTRTARDLEQSRQRLTTARLQERRVVRRELHDGLGPWLAGLRLGLAGVANTVDSDPAAARAMLQTLQEELDRRIEDVRTVARTLLPPVLEELGLEAALSELVTRQAAAGFAVRLRAEVGADLPAPLAAAAYGIASEAVLNAARHSGASGCDLEVTVGDGALRVRCRDDGVGVPST
uniref:sensor histidine kinase n=1 Tax=Desertihabitans aurantiacus TaxID=2282477 RepID=UPI0013002A92